MDFIPIIAQVWGMLAWFIPAELLIGLLKSPWAKGHIGELLVRLFAHWQLDKQTYRRLHNVTLDTPDGTTQIDHVFLSPYGIFVLETKNMSGWIFGSEKQAQWTQKLHKRTFKFQNPLRQNYKHQSPGSHPWRQPRAPALGHYLRRRQHLQDRNASQRDPGHWLYPLYPVISAAGIQRGRSRRHVARSASRPTLATHREHVQNLKRRSDPTAERQCPKCSNALMIRTVKSGTKAGQQFWGCSIFPKDVLKKTSRIW